MPSTNFVAWYLQKAGVNYKAGPTNNSIVYRANNWQEATLVFPINDPTEPIRNAIAAEDRVSVWIGDPAGSGVKMIDGFVLYKYPIRRKDASISLYIDVVDYIGYLAAKSVFEQRYWQLANATAKQIFADAAAAIAGIGGTNIDSNLTQLVQQDFSGTYAKDGFSVASQVGYADYFGDESLKLQAFTHGGRDLLAPNSVRYKIKDTAPSASNEIRINSQFDYHYKQDATYRVRTVITTSGISYTWPNNDINQLQKEAYLLSLYGKQFSKWYAPLNNDPLSWDPNDLAASGLSFSLEPFDFSQTMVIGGINYNVIQLNARKSTDNIIVIVAQISFNPIVYANLGIPLDGTWQEISFFINTNNLSPTPTNIQLQLNDNSGTPGASYFRYLKQGATNILLPGGMTFIRFSLPDPNTGALNGWTSTNPAPTKLDNITIVFTPTTGYTGNVQFSQMLLFRKVRQQSAVLAGSPVTEKIVMNRTITDKTSLKALADAIYNRDSPLPYEVKATFYGNSDFKKPGYAIDADFSTLLESDSKGTQLRMDQIVHYLDNKSRWNTEVTLKPAYQDNY